MKRHCPECHRLLNMPDGSVGHYVRCPACKTSFPVLSAEESLDEAAVAWIMDESEEKPTEPLEEVLKTILAQRPKSPV